MCSRGTVSSGADALLTDSVARPSQLRGQRKPRPSPGVPQPAGDRERDYRASAAGGLRDVFRMLVRAQGLEHAQVGIYGDYFHLNQTTSQSITNGSGETLLQESNVHLLNREFEPKRELEHYWVRPFLVAKVGSDKFFLDAGPATFNCLSSAIRHLHVITASSVFYPGGGLEGRVGGTRAGSRR